MRELYYEGYLFSIIGEYTFVLYRDSEYDVISWAKSVILSWRSSTAILRISRGNNKPYKELTIIKPNLQLSLF